ncbi:uncharacterized protein BX664DRAFT_323381 [Halteromyces radiatus]|uniref:uncharacterized protein n=1 Tax=Halteromyces radiatus TaxID=101107 RepID=UPI00221E8D8A|nr:uncharacterized protein BX664DRAFT_323381 [Halteromyces radiatus]KAI8096204.1 hypothetical protein BX664DRAFT_323381 [Halteromyces radiatus]
MVSFVFKTISRQLPPRLVHRPPVLVPCLQDRCISTTRVRPSHDLQSKADMEKAMNDIEDLYAAAKDEMEYAEESQGSVYYQEDHGTAKKAVQQCLDAYDTFLKELPTNDMRQEVQGKVGFKLKELKMALDALPQDDH